MSTLLHPVDIGNVSIPGNLFLAPLAGYTDRTFRSLCRSFGADFAYTEMVSAEGVARQSAKTDPLMYRTAGEDQLAIQIFSGDVDPVQRSLDRLLSFNPTVIDINCGCPVPKVVKVGAGSQLMRSPESLLQIVSFLTQNTDVPVSVKFRLGWDSDCISWQETAQAALQGGASMLTMHARTRAQGYSGTADWSQLRLLKQWVMERSPQVTVFGSGDLFSAQDAADMLSQTGIDGVMFARGAIGNPFIFREAKALLGTGVTVAPPTSVEKYQAIMAQLVGTSADMGEDAACRELRKHVCAYLKGIPGCGPAKMEIVKARTIDAYKSALGFLLEN